MIHQEMTYHRFHVVLTLGICLASSFAAAGANRPEGPLLLFVATGGTGIGLNGGDRTTLTPAKLYAVNNHIHHYGRISRMYHPGVSVIGVGNRAANSDFLLVNFIPWIE